ncbi:hypothetical protein K388_02792 [Streptomyces sp. KhCrAH-43]|nr:hypothetical protein K388_02792 [Streptomyces sp. KhCrAH-43]
MGSALRKRPFPPACVASTSASMPRRRESDSTALSRAGHRSRVVSEGGR